MTDRLKKLIDEGVVGVEEYVEPRSPGGQHAGMRARGYRIWMPKDSDFPSVDIRICNNRGSVRDRDEAIALFELVCKL